VGPQVASLALLEGRAAILVVGLVQAPRGVHKPECGESFADLVARELGAALRACGPPRWVCSLRFIVEGAPGAPSCILTQEAQDNLGCEYKFFYPCRQFAGNDTKTPLSHCESAEFATVSAGLQMLDTAKIDKGAEAEWW